MIIQALTISLICLAVHALFWEGMILFRFGKIISMLIFIPTFLFCFISLRWFMSAEDIAELSNKIECKLIKPLFDCLICMSSIWTLIVGHYYFHMSSIWTLIVPTLMVCGINVILDSLIYYLRDGGNKL